MGHRLHETLHLDRESADRAQAEKGTPGYSEVYPRGVFPCKVRNIQTGEVVDGWKSITEMYYG